MHDPEVLAGIFPRNQWVIGEQTKGLTHADSLLQPATRGNCLNFVLGHMLANRDVVLKALDLPPMMTEEQTRRYGYGADPVLEDSPEIIPLEGLIVLLEKSAELLVEKIKPLSPEELVKEVKLGQSAATLGERIEFFGWHDTYHVGQTEYLRQLAGTNDKVI